MRHFRLKSTGQVVNEAEYKTRHPAVSFGANFAPRNDAEEVPAPAESDEEHNARIITMLEAIDAKSIRPLREGDVDRVAALEAQAAALRVQLRKA